MDEELREEAIKADLEVEIESALEGDAEPPKIVENNKEKLAAEKEEKEKPKEKRTPKYMSKDEWEAAGKDPDKYKTKEQFDKDGTFLEKIESQSSYIKNLENKLKKVESKQVEREAQEYNYTRQNLENYRNRAYMNGHINDFLQAEEQLKYLQPPEYEPEENTFYKEAQNEDNAFKERNKDWYNIDSIENMQMAGRAEHLSSQLIETYVSQGRMSVKQMIDLVEDQIKKEYPHRFGYDDEEDLKDILRTELAETRREIQDLAPKVESNSIPRSKFATRDIPAPHREIYQEAVRKGLTKLTPKQYYDKLRGRD